MSLIDKIKLLFAIRKPVEDLAGEVKTLKSGWKTVGFWVTVLGTLVTIGTSLAGFLPASTALIISTVLTVLYNIVRSIQAAQVEGTTTWYKSTKFYVGLLGIVAAALEAFKTGGINPAWMVSASGLIGTIMALSQSVAASNPSDASTVAPPPSK